jgi:hypothetical protein
VTGATGTCAARSPSAVGGSTFGTSAGGGSFRGAGAASMEARMREIGGSTAVFFFTSPSTNFCFGFFSSINETLSISRREAGEGFDGGTLPVVGFVAGLSSASFFFGATLDLAMAGLGTAVLRVAGFLAAVLLVAFVAILFREIFVHGSCILSRASFLRFLLSMHCVVDFLCFGFLYAQNIH